LTDKIQSSRYVIADAPGGTGTVRQTLGGVCPGEPYQFPALFGLSFDVNPGPKGNTTIAVSLDGVQILAPIVVCNQSSPCNISGVSGSYGQVGPIIVVPTSSIPGLEFSFVTIAFLETQNLDLFIDRVFLTQV
jgi:hypothetical protein